LFSLPIARNLIFWYPRLLPLRDDRTLEQFTDDIFASIPQGAVLALMDDTAGFAVDYAYFVQKKRQDIAYVSLPMLSHPTYRTHVKKTFPTLIVPQPDAEPDIVTAFIRENSTVRAIVSDRSSLPIPTYWVPWGLVYLSTPDPELTQDPHVFLENLTALWDHFHDPQSQALGAYRHMMLSDVLRFIAEKRLLFAKTLLVTGNTEEAMRQFDRVVTLQPDDLSLRGQWIAWLVGEKKCIESMQVFKNFENDIGMNPQLFLAAQLWVQSCPEEAEQEVTIKKEYDRLAKGSQSIAK
jgi:hypothetical protein